MRGGFFCFQLENATGSPKRIRKIELALYRGRGENPQAPQLFPTWQFRNLHFPLPESSEKKSPLFPQAGGGGRARGKLFSLPPQSVRRRSLSFLLIQFGGEIERAEKVRGFVTFFGGVKYKEVGEGFFQCQTSRCGGRDRKKAKTQKNRPHLWPPF